MNVPKATKLIVVKGLAMLCASYSDEKVTFTNRRLNTYKYRLGVASFPLLMNPL